VVAKLLDATIVRRLKEALAQETGFAVESGPRVMKTRGLRWARRPHGLCARRRDRRRRARQRCWCRDARCSAGARRRALPPPFVCRQGPLANVSFGRGCRQLGDHRARLAPESAQQPCCCCALCATLSACSPNGSCMGLCFQPGVMDRAWTPRQATFLADWPRAHSHVKRRDRNDRQAAAQG